MNFRYILSKALKKMRGSAILFSDIHKSSTVESGSTVINSSMGKHSFCGYNCEIINVEIGNYCSIANNVIIGGAMHPMDWVSMSPVFYEGRDSVEKKFATFKRPEDKKTKVGADVWIGNYALIKQGVEVGVGAVIGMGSVVTKNVGPYEIWAGNPAKLIRKRFDDQIIEKLLISSWWTKDDKEIEKIANTFNNVEKFLNAGL